VRLAEETGGTQENLCQCNFSTGILTQHSRITTLCHLVYILSTRNYIRHYNGRKQQRERCVCIREICFLKVTHRGFSTAILIELQFAICAVFTRRVFPAAPSQQKAFGRNGDPSPCSPGVPMGSGRNSTTANFAACPRLDQATCIFTTTSPAFKPP